MWMLLQALGALGGLALLVVYVLVVRHAFRAGGAKSGVGAIVFPPYWAVARFEHPKKGLLLTTGVLGLLLLGIGMNATAFVGPDVTEEVEGFDDEGWDDEEWDDEGF